MARFWETVNRKRFVGLIAFTVVFFLFIPLIPFRGVMMSSSFFLFHAGIWSTLQVSIILVVFYIVIAGYWSMHAGVDRYFLKRKYNR